PRRPGVIPPPTAIPARPCRFSVRPSPQTRVVERKRTENRDTPEPQFSDEYMAEARAGPAEGPLTTLRVRLGDPECSAMARRSFRAVFGYGDESRQPGPFVPETWLYIVLRGTNLALLEGPRRS